MLEARKVLATKNCADVILDYLYYIDISGATLESYN